MALVGPASSLTDFTLGILALIAAASKASGLQFTLGWEFDPNSIYHPAQIPGLFLLLAAIRHGSGAADGQPAQQITTVAATA